MASVPGYQPNMRVLPVGIQVGNSGEPESDVESSTDTCNCSSCFEVASRKTDLELCGSQGAYSSMDAVA